MCKRCTVGKTSSQGKYTRGKREYFRSVSDSVIPLRELEAKSNKVSRQRAA